MDDQQIGALIRAVRMRRGMRQLDVATAAGLSQACISTVERGHLAGLSIDSLRRIGAVLDIRVEFVARWRAGDAGRLLSRRHSLMAESFAAFIATQPGWQTEPEVSFSIFGERGSIDQLAWHDPTAHLLVVELKTEFVDVNEMLGTLDRKRRLARAIGAARGMAARAVSCWLIVDDTHTNQTSRGAARVVAEITVPARWSWAARLPSGPGRGDQRHGILAIHQRPQCGAETRGGSSSWAGLNALPRAARRPDSTIVGPKPASPAPREPVRKLWAHPWPAGATTDPAGHCAEW
jgi:transcriptional regulator with XRE-family HTH domain